MRAVLFACGALSLLPLGVATAADLQPNAKIRLEFPELPETFDAAQTGRKQPALLTAILPENYTREGRYPLFIYLHGGGGGRGDRAAWAREVVGPRDFIAVDLPLFKDPSAPPATLPPGLPTVSKDQLARMVTAEDGPLLAASYRAMLEKLREKVPNVATERSAIGGFSNGAHAAAALLVGRDPYIREHFVSFYLLEGGLALFQMPDGLRQAASPQRRLLLLFGDKNADSPERRAAATGLHALEIQAGALHLDFTLLKMAGYGHEEPGEYLKLIGCWTRGEAPPPEPKP